MHSELLQLQKDEVGVDTYVTAVVEHLSHSYNKQSILIRKWKSWLQLINTFLNKDQIGVFQAVLQARTIH